MACSGSDSRAVDIPAALSLSLLYRPAYAHSFLNEPVDGSMTDSSYCLIHSSARERTYIDSVDGARERNAGEKRAGEENNRPRPT